MSVLVITDKNPTKDVLMEALQPFHEFECTGIDDQYVVNVDKTTEALEEYATATSTLVVQRPDGTKFHAFTAEGAWKDEVRKYVDPIEHNLRLPRDYVKLCRSEPVKDYQTFVEWAVTEYGVSVAASKDVLNQEKYQHGWILADGSELVRRTNPNAHWDWYVVGGRYGGRLLEKGSPLKQDTSMMAKLDLSEMKQTAQSNRRASLERIFGDIMTQHPLVSEADIRSLWVTYCDNIDTLKDKGNFREREDWVESHPESVLYEVFQLEIHRSIADDWWGLGIPTQYRNLDDWVAAAPAISCWAYVRDGKWYESGKMGWWGVSSDNTDPKEWQKHVEEMISSVPRDHYLTFVDCHI